MGWLWMRKTFFYLIVAADASVLKAAFMSGANETGTGRRGTAGGQSDTCHTGCMALQWRGGGWGVLEGGRGLRDSTSSATATASQQASSTGSISLPSSSSSPSSLRFVWPGQYKARCVSNALVSSGSHCSPVHLIEG